jgi:hypothetical protein
MAKGGPFILLIQQDLRRFRLFQFETLGNDFPRGWKVLWGLIWTYQGGGGYRYQGVRKSIVLLDFGDDVSGGSLIS